MRNNTKNPINEDLNRMKGMMGITENSIQELSPSDIVNSMRESKTEDILTQEELIVYLMNNHQMDYEEANVFSKEDELKEFPMTQKDVEDFFIKLRSDNEESDIPGFEGTKDSLEDLTLVKETETKDIVKESYEGSDSDCCGAPIIMGDICSDCKEHCEPQEEEEEMEFLRTPNPLGSMEIQETSDEVDEESAIGGWDLAMENLDELENELEEEEQSWLTTRGGKEGKVYENKLYDGKVYAQETYFDTQSAALDSAESYALNRGYEADMSSFYPEHVKYGQTVQYHIELKKNDKLVNNKMLHISLYRMDSGKYELTNYIN
mgnify:CR=1 FL=1